MADEPAREIVERVGDSSEDDSRGPTERGGHGRLGFVPGSALLDL